MATSKRLIVWDPQGDWVDEGLKQISTLAELRDIVRQVKSGPFRITFKGKKTQGAFGKFCEAVYHWGTIAPLDVVVEELAWVTTTQKAPGGWLELVTGGLKYGISIYANTQRPSESDKTIMGNATIFRCFPMRRFNDRKAMAQEMDVPIEKINALQALEYVETLPDGPGYIEGKLTFND